MWLGTCCPIDPGVSRPSRDPVGIITEPGEVHMKWTGMYFIGFIVLIGGVLGALWKLGILETIGTTWTVIGVVILIGAGIMTAVSHSGTRENIEIDRK